MSGSRTAGARIALVAALVVAALTGVSRAEAAAVSSYSPPDWWPLRGSNLVGCARNSPGRICESSYHPVWAIDVEGRAGQPIYAAGAGLAKVFSNSTGCEGYGRAVVVEHGGAVKSLYAHMSAFSSDLAASPGGVWVDPKTVIGYIGHTGSTSRCAYDHLHYEETTNGSFWGSATDPGPLNACVDGRLVSYPQAWGATSWQGLAGHTYTARNDGTECGALSDGSFVAYRSHVYRLAGGAPIYVSSWAAVGGPQPTTNLSDAQWATLRQHPTDGTFVSAAGYVYRFAGGAPIYVSSWSAVGGPQPAITIDPAAIDNADNASPWNHVRRYPVDGTFVAAASYIYRFVGGAPVYVSSWEAVGGPQPATRIDHASIDNADKSSPWNHVRRYPADGTFVVATGGHVYRFAGGAPIYVSSWASVGGSQPATAIDSAAIDNADKTTPWNHVRWYPLDGTALRSGPSGAYHVVRDGIVWPGAASSAAVVVDPFAIQHAGGAGPLGHLRPVPRSGYWMLGAAGAIYAFGQAGYHGGASKLNAANIAATPSGNGYWLVTREGRVLTYGDARGFGDSPPLRAGEHVSAVSVTPASTGYWLFTTHGRAFAYGAARHFGDMSGVALNGPVLGSVATPSGNGYYMVASDGGIFAFGDARFHGSMGGQRLNEPVVGLAPDPDGTGYWLVASDGGIFSFHAVFRGSTGNLRLNRPVVGAIAYGDGYLLVASDGGIFTFSSTPFHGSLGGNPPPDPIIAVAAMPR